MLQPRSYEISGMRDEEEIEAFPVLRRESRAGKRGTPREPCVHQGQTESDRSRDLVEDLLRLRAVGIRSAQTALEQDDRACPAQGTDTAAKHAQLAPLDVDLHECDGTLRHDAVQRLDRDGLAPNHLGRIEIDPPLETAQRRVTHHMLEGGLSGGVSERVGEDMHVGERALQGSATRGQRLEGQVASARREPDDVLQHAPLECPDVDGVRIAAKHAPHDRDRQRVVETILLAGEREVGSLRGFLEPRSYDESLRQADREARGCGSLLDHGRPDAEAARKTSAAAPLTNTTISRAPRVTPRRHMIMPPAHTEASPAVA